MEATPKIKRMRSIAECLRLIKADDPESPITYNLLKNLCLDNKVLFVKTGRKIFINYDDLLEKLFA